MNILEQEIEDIVWHGLTNDIKLLTDRGFPCDHYTTYFRQVEIGNYGRADIIGIKPTKNGYGERDVIVDIIELKKDTVNVSTLLQSIRYAKGLKELFEHEGRENSYSFNHYLIGKCIEKTSDFIYATDVIDNVYLYDYRIDLVKGIVFKEQYGYSLRDNGFKEDSTAASSMLKVSMKNFVKTKWRVNEEYKQRYGHDHSF